MVIFADKYRRLKSLDDRRVYAAQDIPADLPDELRKATPAYATDLDPLMQP